jgi:multidrug transporter EmrE-like cation transporter
VENSCFGWLFVLGLGPRIAIGFGFFLICLDPLGVGFVWWFWVGLGFVASSQISICFAQQKYGFVVPRSSSTI